ncbi:MAG TPA: right-handed parallel beta-helix repeat-containing protein [Tepidisphaeraceae bacterium]|nr:right-handed parallel beta-helix repeat-containing protein [Tepidisphaeraceae bacterium]
MRAQSAYTIDGKFAADVAPAARAAAMGRPGTSARPGPHSAASRHVAKAVRPAMMEMLEDRQLLSTYYVSPSGSDSKSGTSTSAPWKTINRVNSQKLKAGDKVLFQGGHSYSGGLYLPSSEGGSASSPVTFGTYGSGKATINSGSKHGLDIAQTAGVSVSNLTFVGNGGGGASGIYLHLDHSGKVKSGFFVNNVEARGYSHDGIEIKINGKGGSSLSNVKIENTQVHDNRRNGLKATANKHNVNKNWILRDVRAFNNPGNGDNGSVTGSGIFVADLDGALIERCVAYNNGKNGHAPVGIWTAGSNRVTVQYCESYDNKTKAISDGGGFDFDWDTHNSVMQYNYSHDNQGPGFLLGAGSHANSNNVVRYNVSENDGRKNGKNGIQLWGNVTNAKIYNNTVFMADSSSSAAFNAHNTGSNGKVAKNIEIRNNIFVVRGGSKVMNITSPVAAGNGLKFVGNAYHSYSGGFKIQWGGSGYGSLADWRNAKGQEKLNGAATGYQGDPKLQSAGNGGTVNGNFSALGAYKLQGSSPLINKGHGQPTFLASVVKTDFFGGNSLLGGRHDIGVDEVR